MERKAVPDNNPWSNLMTITKFDRGNNTKTTIRWDTRSETQNNEQIIPAATSSISLLIESLIKQICTMFEGDTVRRNKLYFKICDRLHEIGLIDTSYNSMELEGIRGQFQHALYRLVALARTATGSEHPLNVPSCLMAEWSRYRREFHEISFIGGGGFGNVYKALHRLDGIEYAVKKIIVQSGHVSTIKQHLEEVKSLAKLNHMNIVAYKTAWIEPTLVTTTVPSLPNVGNERSKSHFSKYRAKRNIPHQSCKNNNFNNNSQLISNSNNSKKNSGQDISLKSDKEVFYKTGMYFHIENNAQKHVSGSAGGYIISHDIINERFLELNSLTNIIGQRIIERSSSTSTEDTSDIVSFRNDSNNSKSNNDYSRSNANYIVSDSNDESSSDINNQIYQYKSRVDPCYATLYIQMALCDKTLQQWLKERDDSTSQQTITTIFTQILQGVDHIHSLGMVHHDIKPSNIFITAHFQIQLGDFGLACPLQRKDHDSVFGTHMYAAPEQLKGKCNPKSDIYSIGIVLLELLIYTKTQMELCCIIDELKKDQLPVSLIKNHPKWAHIICQLIQEDPNKRPSTDELLQNVTEDKDVVIAQLKHDIVKKDNTIRELQEKITMLQAFITKSEPPSENQ
ncbi:eIF-2-alpha kinase GCN2-like isoform X1 [Vespa mandarinia]|uniref:eIF-2-alpha kinase GCN2-like isoform X1 n=1 Tax=Vespa mandarinia TaxID=7446 RepID=UPI00162021D8|nr:eIF-2-alpha kinase GCN2-like isoform X1 [Vespa mandarinia]XP_035739610.1 eIF-2-alpha kinase GCN2-like isoform X1 [Vespa mandarinia]XP_035739611.1 eIF-2-alpha kinase GCN2-like isoform X1 [Vespa mandarinia]